MNLQKIEELSAALRDARNYTLAAYADLPEALWEPARVPYLPIINPPLWELGHIAWFQEFWCHRYAEDDPAGARTSSLLTDADAMLNSGIVPHRTRWSQPFPDKNAILGYMNSTLDGTLERLAKTTPAQRYFYRLALLHEDMHGEALQMTLKTLGLPLSNLGAVPVLPTGTLAEEDLVFEGGLFRLGTDPDADSFVFDNEEDAHDVELEAFVIAPQPVVRADYERFVRSDDYRNEKLWSSAGRAWLAERGRDAISLDRMGGAAGEQPAMHVSYFAAEAFCRWAGRRLPTETEWEFAAVRSPAFWASVGQVWEWTSSPFEPYPGFQAGPYREYSEPWFHTHQVLRGGSFATRRRLMTPRFRNFYLPDRNDMFVGFRTCAL